MRERLNALRALPTAEAAQLMEQGMLLLAEAERADSQEIIGDILHQLGKAAERLHRPDEAIKYLERAYQVHVAHGQMVEAISDLNCLGRIHFDQSRYAKAKDAFEQELSIAHDVHDSAKVATATTNIGSTFSAIGKSKEALECYQQALSIYEQMGKQKEIASCLLNIGNLYHHQGNYEVALETFQQALLIADTMQESILIITLYINIGAIHMIWDKADVALSYYNRSLEMSRISNYPTGLLTSQFNISDIYVAQFKYDLAIGLLTQCLKLSHTLLSTKNEIFALTKLGEAHRKNGNIKEGEEYLLHALSLAKEDNMVYHILQITMELSQLYEAFGDSSKALTYYKEHRATKDEIINIETKCTVEELKTKYEVERKEKEAEIHRLLNVELNDTLDKVGAEKAKADALLLNILPADVAEELKIDGKVKARHYPIAAVMFVDIRNFTIHGMSMWAEALVSTLDEYIYLIDETISHTNIEKIKTIGDAYLCVAGIPEPSLDCVVEMVDVAIVIRDTIFSFNEIRTTEGKPVFEFRFGIHAGPVVAGVVGRLKFEYDIWGDTVNTAARMEQQGEANKINISGAVYELVRNQYACTYRGKIEAKNKGLIDMYFAERM